MAAKTKQIKVCGGRSDIGNPQSWWVDTGILVNAGNSLTINATNSPGLILPWGGHPGFGPAGDNWSDLRFANRDWPETLANRTGVQSGDTNCWFGSLIGKIGRDGQAFAVGQSKTFTPTTSGTLFLAFNDGVSFQDNSGFWNVTVTFEELVQLAPTGYGTNKIFADRINTSLVDAWGVILTVQEGVTDPSAIWNSIATSNLIGVFNDIQSRLQARASRTFKQVFAGLEMRFSGPLGGAAGVTFNENLIRFSDVTRGTVVTRLDNRSWGKINPAAGFNYYPSSIPYGFFNSSDKGIRNTVIHELGHVLDFRSTSIDATATQFRLKVLKDLASPNVDSSLDIGTFWENPATSPIGEIVGDNFLNWIRNSYVGIENAIDTYPQAGTNEQKRASAYWLGRQFTLPETGGSVTSPGIVGFTGDAAPFANNTTALLRSLGTGETDLNCTF